MYIGGGEKVVIQVLHAVYALKPKRQFYLPYPSQPQQMALSSTPSTLWVVGGPPASSLTMQDCWSCIVFDDNTAPPNKVWKRSGCRGTSCKGEGETAGAKGTRRLKLHFRLHSH